MFFKKEKSIYISYTFKGEKFEREYFKISKTDSAKASSFDFLCNANSADNWVKTKFTGDTTIKIPGKKIRCWIFTETYYLLFRNKISRVIYLDKKSLLPIQINITYYRPDPDNPSINTAHTYKDKIDSVFSRPWNSSNKKWNYPKCWKTGYTSSRENQ